MNFKQALINLLLIISFLMMHILLIEPAKVTYTCELASEKLTVYVEGAVERKSVIEVNEGDLMEDLMSKISLKASADLSGINRNRKLYNGQTIIIPYIDGPLTIDQINRMTLDELKDLKGVGDKTARNILSYISEYGPFVDREEMLLVSGIGQSKLEDIFSD